MKLIRNIKFRLDLGSGTEVISKTQILSIPVLSSDCQVPARGLLDTMINLNASKGIIMPTELKEVSNALRCEEIL